MDRIFLRDRKPAFCLTEAAPELPDLLRERLKFLRETYHVSLKAGISNQFQDITYAQHAATQAKRRLSAGYHIDGVFVFTHTHSSRAIRSLISIQELDNLQACHSWRQTPECRPDT